MFLIYFGGEHLTGYVVCKYFLPFHGLPFHSVVSLAVQKLFDLMPFHLFLLPALEVSQHNATAKTDVMKLFPISF